MAMLGRNLAKTVLLFLGAWGSGMLRDLWEDDRPSAPRDATSH